MATSTSSASGSTVTVAEEVCTRPLDSVTGTRCTRCGPASCSSRAQASRPFTSSTASFSPSRSETSSERTSTFQPRSAAKRRYIVNRSRAKRLASSPPSAPRISTITLRPSLGSSGSSKVWRRTSNRSMLASAVSISARSTSRSSPWESSRSSVAVRRSERAVRSCRQLSTISASSLWRMESSRRRLGSAEAAGDASSASTASNSFSSAPRRSSSTGSGYVHGGLRDGAGRRGAARRAAPGRPAGGQALGAVDFFLPPRWP